MLVKCPLPCLATRWFTVYRNFTTTPLSLSVKASTLQSDEYNEVAQYPEILDLSHTSRKKRASLSWQKEIQISPTVEEKLLKINMPRYYGYKVVELHDERLPYNILPAIQHYTRTLYETMPSEPIGSEKISSHVNSIKGDVKDALEFSYDYFSQKHKNTSKLEPKTRERIWTQVVVEQINRVLLNALANDYQHLQEAEVDLNPRHEAFWSVGGMNPPKNVVKSKEGRSWQKDFAKELIDRFMQYKSQPMLCIRYRSQLPIWKNEEEYNDIEKAKTVPRLCLDPRSVGFSTGYQHGTNIPGHWPTSSLSFGAISYQSRAGIHIRPQAHSAEDHNEALHAHAIQSSFAWLLSQANYYGFNTYSELTYPLNTQTILTDGKIWSFYEYQLNTLLMSGSQIDENPRVNCCRGSQELSLYQEFDENGKVVGFNDEPLKYLMLFYINNPNIRRSSEALQPFLDVNYKRIADYEDGEKREFIEKIFKHLAANRPRHLAIPEIYLWEKIYKIDNKTRPLDTKRRYFELFVNPWKRKLDQHQKVYIPRRVRPGGHRSKKKWEPTFYP